MGTEERKLRGLWCFPVVLGTTRSPRSAERRFERPETVDSALTNVPEVGRTSASDAVESHRSDLVLDALCDRQPVQRVAECRHGVIIQSDACDEPGGSVKHRLKTPNNVSTASVQDGIAGL